MSYSFLEGTRVLEVALLAGGVPGMYLADMGAEVIKVENPAQPDYTDQVGFLAVGSPSGPSFKHLRWNRGKKSIAIDLKSERGREIFLELVEQSHVVLEGLRAGAMEKWDLGYDVLAERNPPIVLCSLSGMGKTGPYSTIPTHGYAYDSFTGLANALEGPDGEPRAPTHHGPFVEFNAGGLFAAYGTLAALIKAQRTGKGSVVEVAQIEALAMMRPERLEAVLNKDKVFRRGTYGEGEGFATSVRANYYPTKDGKVFFLEATEDKFWVKLCESTGRPDLAEKYPSRQMYDHAPGNEEQRKELQDLFRTRTLTEWLEFCAEQGLPGTPVYTQEEFPYDAHFQARDNVQTVNVPNVGEMQLLTNPVRTVGDTFTIRPPLMSGQDTDDLLAELLELDSDTLAELRAEKVIR